MKIYDTLQVDTTVQLNGSNLLLILIGAEEQIELTFNGLFNFNGVGKRAKLEYTTSDKTIAIVWSSREKMNAFFYNRHKLKFGCKKRALAWADAQLKKLLETSHSFTSFEGTIDDQEFGTGTTCAEKPDHDFKTAVIEDGLTEKNKAKDNEPAEDIANEVFTNTRENPEVFQALRETAYA